MAKFIHKCAAWKTRRDFGHGDKIRDKGQTTPSDVIRFDDIVYGMFIARLQNQKQKRFLLL